MKTHAAPSHPDGTGTFATGKYHNLFVESGHSQQEVRARIDAAYEQLFHGDLQTQSVLYPAGNNDNGPLMYVMDVASNDVRSEGMSYGMMIAVQLNKKTDFDAIWNWARTYMYVSDPKHPNYGFFSWSCKPDGTANDDAAAPDGEEYFATALLFAANRWPGGKGIYDYHGEALRLLTDMRHRAVITGNTLHGEKTMGPLFNEEHAMVLFTPNRVPAPSVPEPFTDPSYHLPAFYELWARWGPAEDRAFWSHAADVSRKFFVITTHPRIGLSPSYASFDGSPRTWPYFNVAHIFSYDAWRTAANWSVDWTWWHKAASEQQLSNRILNFFESQGMDTYSPLYELDGKRFDPNNARPTTALIAANAIAGMAATDRKLAKQFTDALWNTPIPAGKYRYYDGVWYLMGMMHVSGE
ncbi:MAG: glycosyl hydrolase family 8, partial [Steroidobacter sp.]